MKADLLAAAIVLAATAVCVLLVRAQTKRDLKEIDEQLARKRREP